MYKHILIYIYILICVYIYIYVLIYIYILLYIYIYLYADIYIYIHWYVYISIYWCLYIYIFLYRESIAQIVSILVFHSIWNGDPSRRSWGNASQNIHRSMNCIKCPSSGSLTWFTCTGICTYIYTCTICFFFHIICIPYFDAYMITHVIYNISFV